MTLKWNMKGSLIGACSCDWGCPCSFDAPPTKGFCHGVYVWQIASGCFGDVPLGGLALSWLANSPAALHKGNVACLTLIDEKADSAQRAALTKLTLGKSGGPWAVFAAVASESFGPEYVPFEIITKGLDSRARLGSICEIQLGPIVNPVSNQPEEIYVDKPTGFTSKHLILGATKTLVVKSKFEKINFDHSGQYGEFSQFEYGGEAED
jgi:hypothetical protein